MAEFSPNEIHNREHIAPDKTGDNIAAKKVANYVWDSNSSSWVRQTPASAGGGGLVQIQDSSGNNLTSSGGALNVAGSFSGTTAPANNNYGTAAAVTDGSTGTLVNIASSSAGYKIRGFVANGTGDGYFFVQVAGTTILSAKTNSAMPTAIIPLPNPIPVATASAVTLKVTNKSGSTADFEGTLLGE